MPRYGRDLARTANWCSARVWGDGLDHWNVDRDHAALLRRAGVPHVPFHGLRHTHATLMPAAGVPVKVVSERLGHSTASMTAGLYQHVISGMAREAASQVDSLLA